MVQMGDIMGDNDDSNVRILFREGPGDPLTTGWSGTGKVFVPCLTAGGLANATSELLIIDY